MNISEPSPRTLAEMSNRPTAYEVVLDDNGTLTRLGFTARRTNAVLVHFARAHGKEIIALLDKRGIGDDDGQRPAKLVWSLGKGVSVRFSGRTERECASLAA